MSKAVRIAILVPLSITLLLFHIYLHPKSVYTIESPLPSDQNFNQAKISQQSGDFKKALELYDNALEIAKKIQDRKRECDCLINIGLLYWNMGQLPKSTETYEAAQKLADKFNLKIQKKECEYALEIYLHYTKAKELRNKSEMAMAISEFQTAIEKAKEAKSEEHELKCLRQLSVTYWDMNNFQKCYIFSKRALEIAEKINHKREIGNNSNNIGLYFWKITEFSKALNYYQKALEIARELENKYEESSCLNNMGIIYKNIGNYDKALDVLNEALELDRKLGNQDQISGALNNIGIIYRIKFMLSNNKNDFEFSIKHFYSSLNLSKKKGDIETEIKILNNIGSLYSDAKRYPDALKFFDDAYFKASQNNDTEAMGMVLNNIGIVHYNQGNYDESTRYFQRSIDLASKIFGGQILWEAYLELANTYKEQSKFQLALENYKASITNIENIRSNIQLEEHKASYLGTDKRITAYKNLIDLLVTMQEINPDNGYAQEAFSYVEQAKARAFLDSLEMSKIDITHHIDFRLINQEKELQKNITKIYNTLIDAGASAEDKSVLENQLKKYEDELEALRIEIRAKYSAYAELNFPKAITLQEAQNLLDGKTAFFAYSVGSAASHAFVITHNDIALFEIPPRNELQEIVSDYLKVITDRENQNFQLGHELYNKLVKPGLRAEIKNIIFIPGDILNFLPFETLITQENTHQWLIKEHRIAYAPSISSLNELIKRKKANGTKRRMEFLAFGDPFFGSLEVEENGDEILQDFFSTSVYNLYRLEYSNTEIEKISAHFKKKRRTTFQRLDASEEQLKSQALDEYKIIHFATHSLVDNKKPARSSIVLSLDNDEREDGFLQMREIYNLKLNSDLVTLSACQTGLGQFIRGEGIEGINRAFFYAGASSVLMSLWAVNDQATYQLMERFYTYLRSSESIMNSLRRAKLEMINSEILSHPYYWAGFIVSGKADQIIFPKSLLIYVLAAASIVVLCMILIMALKRKFIRVNRPK